MNAIKARISGIKNAFRKLGSSPEADWHFALGVFVVAVVLTIALDAFLFLGLGASDGSEGAANVSPVTLNSKDLTNTIEALSKDDEASAVIPPIVEKDPSI